jgi:hypothetical protein
MKNGSRLYADAFHATAPAGMTIFASALGNVQHDDLISKNTAQKPPRHSPGFVYKNRIRAGHQTGLRGVRL